ncbi:MAG: lactate utilization protein, partial [Acetobacteraceae bacterium]|nr:lactate utilization protein [Acetobacteraceae bacterium]
MSAVTYETEALTGRDFPERAREELRDSQLRGNIRKATTTIRAKTAEVTGELPDWQDLRRAGQAIKREAMRDLARNLEALEANVSRAGGKVHWARDAAEARWIITNLAQAAGAEMVIKVKSMTTDEIGLNPALAAAGIRPIETDLADMIVQLGHDTPSHILVPAIHKNRAEIREIFMRAMGLDHLGDQPTELTAAARRYLRERFLSAEVAISGGNFGIADTGTICVLESEGNGRMCLSLPRVLITLLGIEKVLPRFE